MRCVILLLALGQVGPAGTGDTKSQRVEVSGSVALPPEAKAPAKFRVVVEILKVEPGRGLTLLRSVGRLQLETARSFPVNYTVACPKSVLKDTPANQFILRASVYEHLAKGGVRLIYRTPDKDRIEALSANGEGRKDVRLTVEPVKGK